MEGGVGGEDAFGETLDHGAGEGEVLDVGAFALFDGCTTIVCACGLGDVAFAGRHWDVFGLGMKDGKDGRR